MTSMALRRSNQALTQMRKDRLELGPGDLVDSKDLVGLLLEVAKQIYLNNSLGEHLEVELAAALRVSGKTYEGMTLKQVWCELLRGLQRRSSEHQHHTSGELRYLFWEWFKEGSKTIILYNLWWHRHSNFRHRQWVPDG